MDYIQKFYGKIRIGEINMTRAEECAKIQEAIEAIDFKGEYVSHEKYGSGHINDTFLVRFQREDGTIVKYILQRMNHHIFNPDQLMQNICNVTSFLREKIIKNGGNPDRETMNVIPTKDGKPYFKDSIGSCWRGYAFIHNATCYDQVEKPEDFYQSAVTFGRFQSLLSDFKADTLYETIVDFHNTPKRFETFKEVVKKDICNRASGVQEEIDFVMSRAEDMKICTEMLKNGELPLRVTHNDTKLNNVLIDNETGKGLCVIDLDTVMPGLSIFDFGDSIRFGANTAMEDEKDLSKVSLDLNLFEQYAAGFLEGCNGSLTENELKMLPIGAKIMTLECGMRFLTDYLQGDVYFNIHRPEHNLDRCRTQFKLVEDMEGKMDQMHQIIRDLVK
mgnify:CR=1 FL=1|jgi:hypothetical protein